MKSIEFIKVDEHVAIWGSGSGYERWKNELKFNISCIVDSNPQKWGTYINGIEVISPETLKENFNLDNTKILILSFFIQEITEQIINLGFLEKNIFSIKHLERSSLLKEKKLRFNEYQKEAHYTLKQFIEKLEDIYSHIIYRGVNFNSVMLPYITLLSNRLYSEHSNENLFPLPKIKPYVHNNRGPILISYVWHEKRRKSHNILMKKYVEKLPNELLSELIPASFYNEEEFSGDYLIFKNDEANFSSHNLLDRLVINIQKSKLNLNHKEFEWLINFTKYFMGFVDFSHEFFGYNNYKLYISAYSNNPEENIMVQVAKQYGITTFTLQHGTYGKAYELEKVPFSHVYKYLSTDYALLWGKHWVRVLEEVLKDDTKLKIVGNPRFDMTKEKRNQLKNSKKEFINKEKFMICFFGPGQDEFPINQKMLEIGDAIANNFGWNYIVKMHPENKVLPSEFKYNENKCIEFIKNDSDIHELYNSVDFLICSSSTIIHEAVMNYLPIFVINGHNALDSICGNLSTRFDDSNQILKSLDNLLTKKNFQKLLNEYDVIGEEFFELSKSVSIGDKYKNIFMSFLE